MSIFIGFEKFTILVLPVPFNEKPSRMPMEFVEIVEKLLLNAVNVGTSTTIGWMLFSALNVVIAPVVLFRWKSRQRSLQIRLRSRAIRIVTARSEYWGP